MRQADDPVMAANPYRAKPHRQARKAQLAEEREARRAVEAAQRSAARSIRDVAATACGMVHRDGWLLMPVAAEVLLRDRKPFCPPAPSGSRLPPPAEAGTRGQRSAGPCMGLAVLGSRSGFPASLSSLSEEREAGNPDLTRCNGTLPPAGEANPEGGDFMPLEVYKAGVDLACVLLFAALALEVLGGIPPPPPGRPRRRSK